jgi:hypothetical protein
MLSGYSTNPYGSAKATGAWVRRNPRDGGTTGQPAIPLGTVGQHAKGKVACEVCGAETEDEGQVTAHYIEAHAR